MRISWTISLLALVGMVSAQETPKAPIVMPEIPKQPMPQIVKDNSKLPHVVLISMGGTIAARATDRMNITEYGNGPAVEPEDWIHDLPELANIARVTTDDMRSPKAVTMGAKRLKICEMWRSG